jgi:ABC-type uncharacterized transport system ATPase subunit/ABC-type uncharacterized transport system permease subunit
MDQPILELRHITKAFGQKVANDDISLSVFPGRVHALVGENGAGKTTLMNMVSGNLLPDSGEILFDGSPVALTDPKKADALGIGMVHQHFKLVGSLTVAANVFLGKEALKGVTLDHEAMATRVTALSEKFGLKVNPNDVVDDLSVGERQRVEVLKALSHDTRVLILDEPTAVLTPAETDEMFVVIRQLAAQGCAVVFISHKLGEVLAIADEVTVVRDGRIVSTQPAAGLSQTDIASMMVGREVLLRVKHSAPNPTGEVLRVDNLYAVDSRGAIAVNDLSLSVRRGEIVGIAGVEGNGQSELAAAIAGMHEVPRGTVTLADEDVTGASVARRRAIGLAYIPEDRYDEGSGPNLTVAENMVATHLTPPIAARGVLSIPRMKEFAASLIARFDVRGSGPDTIISTLSGGNMQKVIIAREFSAQPELLMVSQPTRGVDVGAMEFVHNSIVAARDAGAGVLLFSADLNEVMSLSDRLLVMYRGQIIAEFTHENMSEIAVGLAMAGERPTAEALAEAEADHARAQAQLAQAGLGDGTETALEAEVGDDVAVAAPLADADVRPQSLGVTRSLGAVLKEAVTGALQPVVAVLIALAIGAVIILALGDNPLSAYVALFTSGWRTPFGIASIVAAFIPLSIMAGATIISFRAGFFNIGGEGQMYLGAFFGAYAGFTFASVPGPLLTVTVLVFGAIAGALWGIVPGWLLARWKVDIVVTTLLLSEIAKLATMYFVTGAFQDPTAGMAASAKIAPSARLTMFNAQYGIGPDLIIAIVVAVLLALVLNRTTWGLKVKELGELNRFAEYTGVSSRSMSVQVMALSGAVSGFAGALFVLGPNGGRFLQAFSPGWGFLAITVALLARLNPWGAFVAAIFYATMMGGSTGLQATGVPFPLVNVLQGLIIIMITATFVWSRRRAKTTTARDSAPAVTVSEGSAK